jgi:nicotinate-nucleotide--dimethylbenzimidazole phosphoribosyltransferase
MNIAIPPLDKSGMQLAHNRQAMLLKPQGALGQLETLSIRLVGMTGRLDWLPQRRVVPLFAADHGIMAHGVSTVPQSITAYMLHKFMAGEAAINVLARQMNARLTVIDAGVNADLDLSSTDAVRFVSRKIAPGTADFSTGHAMTDRQAARALQLGADVVAADSGGA